MKVSLGGSDARAWENTGVWEQWFRVPTVSEWKSSCQQPVMAREIVQMEIMEWSWSYGSLGFVNPMRTPWRKFRKFWLFLGNQKVVTYHLNWQSPFVLKLPMPCRVVKAFPFIQFFYFSWIDGRWYEFPTGSAVHTDNTPSERHHSTRRTYSRSATHRTMC